MNFLKEVMGATTQVDLDHIKHKLPALANGIESCKSDLNSYVDSAYVKFEHLPRHKAKLIEQVRVLQDELDSLKSESEVTKNKIYCANVNKQEQISHVATLELTVEILTAICDINKGFFDIRQLLDQLLYKDCFAKIKEVGSKLDHIEEVYLTPILDEYYLTLCTEESKLNAELSNIFDDNVHLISSEKSARIEIQKSCAPALTDVLSALYFHKSSVDCLDHVTKFLWDNIFTTIVNCVTKIIVKDDTKKECNILEIDIIDPMKKQNYETVFGQIEMVLEFLVMNFKIVVSNTDDQELSTLAYIGKDIQDNLSEVMIKNCLQDTIPLTSDGLRDYKKVIEDTKRFEKILLDAEFFSSETNSILLYVQNIDYHFVNKRCKEYLVQSEEIMKKDLHDMIQVGEVVDHFEVPAHTFPKCCISRNVVTLLNLMEKMLGDSLASSEACADRLLSTVQNICKSYPAFVSKHHKKLLQTIPQQVALFLNNCTYMEFKITQWKDSYVDKLPLSLKDQSTSLIADGTEMKQTALTLFSEFVEGQTRQIEAAMKESYLGSHNQILDQVESGVEKAIRQCLRQAELLKTVWSKVLPYRLYNQTLGKILECLCGALIPPILRYEDISSDAAEQLADILKMVQTRGPKLFSDPHEVSLFVGSWYRLNELSFVLRSRLLEIDDRWADGKGPIGLQFTAKELRQLIRALFQNTELRTALLLKIRD